VRGSFLISKIYKYGEIVLGVAIFCKFPWKEWFLYISVIIPPLSGV
jgi:hypothetical protein